MKYLVLAVLLAVMQTSPPVPRKAADNPTGSSQNVKKHSEGDRKPVAQPTHPVQTIGTPPDQQHSEAVQNGNTGQSVRIRELPPVSITRDWMDKLSLLFAGILLFVGSLGVRAAYKTLKAIEAQTTEIAKSVKAAEVSADAALLNAKAIINSERPWVMIQIKEVPVERGDGVFDMRSFQFTIFNYGKSPAHLLSCKGPKLDFHEDPDKDLPIPPDYGAWCWERKFLAPRDSSPMGKTIYPSKIRLDKISEAVATGKEANRGELVAYGLVEYSDGVSDTTYKTAFCYRHEKQPASSMGGHFVVCGPTGYNAYT